MMNIVISNTSDKPIYKQIFDQISSQILKGDLKSNEPLPPIRTVAKELRVSVITIKKAWEELEGLGFIHTMVGRGSFVADLSAADISGIRKGMINKKLLKDIEYYRELGITMQELIESIRAVYTDEEQA